MQALSHNVSAELTTLRVAVTQTPCMSNCKCFMLSLLTCCGLSDNKSK